MNDSNHRPAEYRSARSIHLDLLKSIAIFLVCFYHVKLFNDGMRGYVDYSTYINYFVGGVATISIPLFFMVNGALLLNKQFDLTPHINKIIKIYLLVFLWGSLALIFGVLYLGDHYSPSGFLWALWELKAGRINHLWFLKTVVLIYLLLPIIKLAYDNDNKRCIIFFSATVFVFSFGNLLLNWGVNLARFFVGTEGFDIAKDDRFNFFPTISPFGNHYFAILYFVLGGYLGKLMNGKEPRISTPTLIAGFILCWLSLFGYGIMKHIQTKIYFDIVWEWYSMPTLFMSIFGFILIHRLNIENRLAIKLIQTIGKHTLGIYLIHGFIRVFISPIFIKLGYSESLMVNLFYALTIMLIALSAAMIINKIPIIRKIINI